MKTVSQLFNDFNNFIDDNPVDYVFNNLDFSGYRHRILKAENGYTIEIALPGFNKDEIDISVNNDILIISYVEKKEVENSFWQRSFKKSFSLGASVDIDDVTAKFENGILKIGFKTQKSNSKTVKIS
jgi:HSP20 family protein